MNKSAGMSDKILTKKERDKAWVRANRKKINERQAEKQRQKTKDPEARRKRCEYRRAHAKANPDLARAASLRKLYGITLEQYKEMLQQQNGVCAICYGNTKHMLSVDHDHKTGEIRGLLCNNCNPGLGKFKDSVEILQKAINYLQKGRK